MGPGGTRGAALSEGQRVAVGLLFLLSSDEKELLFLPLDEEGRMPKWPPEELEALRCLRDSGLPSVHCSFCPRAGVWPGAPGVERVATQHRAAFCRVRSRSPFRRGVAKVGPGGTRGAALSEGQRVAVGPLFLLSSSWGMARGPRGGTCRYAAQGCVLPRSFPVPRIPLSAGTFLLVSALRCYSLDGGGTSVREREVGFSVPLVRLFAPLSGACVGERGRLGGTPIRPAWLGGGRASSIEKVAQSR